MTRGTILRMSRTDALADQLRHTRWYTQRVLDHCDRMRWFEMPGGITHIAWQVGHLAVGQHGHILRRVAGAGPGTADGDLVPAEWRDLFDGGSTPNADASRYPAPDAITSVFDAVFQRSIHVVQALTDADLDAPTHDPQHWAAPTKWHMILWNLRHEGLHCGQIGLLHRLLGERPYR